MTNLEKLYELDKELTNASYKVYFAEMLGEINEAFNMMHKIRIDMHNLLKTAKEDKDKELEKIKGEKGRLEGCINRIECDGKMKARKIYNPELYTRAELRETVHMQL